MGKTMMAWMDPWSRRGAWLSLGLLLVACAGVLGIEERQLDSAESYPAEGYDGCRPGADCAGCLDVHKDECQVRGACVDAVATDNCAGCVCENCLELVVDCQLDTGCAAIWQCLRETRCDISEHASNTCLEDCRSVIQSHGGVNGEAFSSAAGIRTCAVTSQCLSCLAPQPEPSPSCNQANGCQDCDACFQQCLCTGELFGACKALCAEEEEAPPESCTPEASCAGCADCFQLCACGGGTFGECTTACQGEPLPNPTCTPEAGCDCNGACVATCVCGGSEQSLCEDVCAPPAPDDVCSQDNQGSQSQQCGGCNSCLADCTCRGTALEQCMEDCRLNACCDVSGGCSADLTNCMCAGYSGADCAGTSCDVGSCDTCVCQNCPGTYALCQQTLGCPAIFECMRSTNCHGSQCQERCSGVNAGPGEAAEAFDVAEALWSCHQGNQCTCTSTTPPVTVTCLGPDGAVQCAGYSGNGVEAAACCPPAVLETTKAGGSGTVGVASCGLEMQRYLPAAQQCEPMGQPRDPAILLGCQDGAVAAPPYNGATLQGCCHEADNTCGYYDDVTGLGCLSASAFGFGPGEPCGIIHL